MTIEYDAEREVGVLVDAAFAESVESATPAPPGFAAQRKQARISAGVFALGAAGVAATPLGIVSDSMILAPIQMAMVNKISGIYGRPPVIKKVNQLACLSLSAAATIGGRTAARYLIRRTCAKLVRRIPVVGPAVSCLVAAAVTIVMAEVWIAVCEYAATHELANVEAFLDSPVGQAVVKSATSAAWGACLAATGWGAVLEKLAGRIRHIAEASRLAIPVEVLTSAGLAS